jgi:hypothetical protein
VSRQETPDAWVKESLKRTAGGEREYGSYDGGTGRGPSPSLPETATCALCGAWRGQLGLEPTVEMFVAHTIEWMREVKRVLRKDGVFFLDIDDSRHGSWGDYVKGGEKKNKRSGKRWTRPGYEAAAFHERPPTADRGRLHKSLRLIPQRVAIAAQEDGWIVRSQIVIPSWMPESARDRPTDAYRVVLMLCKQKAYWYDAAAVRVASDQKRGSVVGSGVQGTNLSPEGFIGRRYLRPSDQDPVGLAVRVRDAVRLATAILQLSQRQDDLSLPSLDSEIWEQRLGNDSGLPMGDHPNVLRSMLGLTAAALFQVCGAAEDLLEQLNGFGFCLVDSDALRVLNILGVSENSYLVTPAPDHDRAVRVYDPSEVGEIDVPHAMYSTASVGYRQLGNIWHLPPSAYPAAHFATFPVAEPERCILASCPAEVCVKCGRPRVRIIKTKKVLEDDKARAYMPEGPARPGAHRDALRRGGHRHDNPFQEMHEEAGWTDCGCRAGFEADELEIIETPTGERTGDDPSFVTGRAGYNRPRGPNEGSRPITRYEQRRYARQLRDSPHRADMEADAGPAFAHYLRTDKSGARPIPPELLETWIERGWLERVILPEALPGQYEPGLVLDPFMGTGTTAIAAVKLGRRCIGIDLSEDYLKQAVTRLTVGDAGVRRMVAAERAGAKQESLL